MGGESTQTELTTSGAVLEPHGTCSEGACSSVFSTSGEDIRALVDALNWPSGHILLLCWIRLPPGGEQALPLSDEPTDGFRPRGRVTLNGGLYVGDVAACRFSWYFRALADCGEPGEDDKLRSLGSYGVRCEPCEAIPGSARLSRCGRWMGIGCGTAWPALRRSASPSDDGFLEGSEESATWSVYAPETRHSTNLHGCWP